MTIGKRLKELRKNAGLTQAQVGALFTPAIERAAVAQWEGDKTRPDQDRLETLARAYRTTIDYILKGRSAARLDSPNVDSGTEPFGKVPIISWAQASNFATVLDKLHADGGVAEWAATTVSIHKHTYALRVRGDSMVSPSGEPTFPEGQVIIVEPDAVNEPNALVGQFVIVRRAGEDETTFKQLVKDSGGFYLKPLNPQYPMHPLAADDVICGVVRQKVVTFF